MCSVVVGRFNKWPTLDVANRRLLTTALGHEEDEVCDCYDARSASARISLFPGNGAATLTAQSNPQ